MNILLFIILNTGFLNDHPANSTYIGDGYWYCDNGYKKTGNQCEKIYVPPNAGAVGGNWYCDMGYAKNEETCKEYYVPSDARITINSWSCNAGYKVEKYNCVLMSDKEKRMRR